MKVVKVSKQRKVAGSKSVQVPNFAQVCVTESASDRAARAQAFLDATREQFALSVANARQLLPMAEEGVLAGPASCRVGRRHP